MAVHAAEEVLPLLPHARCRWLQHSAITSTLRAADPTLYRINIAILLIAAFVPFPTKLLTEFIANQGRNGSLRSFTA